MLRTNGDPEGWGVRHHTTELFGLLGDSSAITQYWYGRELSIFYFLYLGDSYVRGLDASHAFKIIIVRI